MKHLSVEESEAWILERGFQSSGDDFKHSEHLCRKVGMHVIAFTFSQVSRLIFPLSCLVADFIDDSECLFWASRWSSEELPNFENFRAPGGSTLLDNPATLFEISSDHERATMKMYIFFFLCTNWEGYVISRNSSKVIWLADEVIEIWSERDLDAQFIEDLKDFGVDFI